MSSVGSIVYFMGQGLDPDTSSPVVHCNMANFEPWIESSQPPKGIESMFFPPSISLPGSEPPSPNHETKEHPLMSLASSTEISVSSSLLPSYDSLPPPMNPHTASFLFFTPYRRMHTATDDSQFEKIKIDLSTEWMTCAMIVMCLIGVDSAILGLSKEGTIMPMDTSGERAIAVSMMSSAIGLAVSAWMYCIYYPQEGDLFRLRALDALNTYAIFSIRARIPILCVGVATSAFLIFVVHTLSAMFPEVVAPLLALLGILIGLNWFIYFYHLVRFAFSYVSKAVLYVFRRGSTPPPAETTDGNSKQSSEATAAS
ncbi:uncharacterized protein EI90DRAFT_3047402 [Cantharellus anzutake]|uniref:uncharacterized protein n=1 Tax=Cantharellus anzutake TaxID=1750568 RepID=UPI0019050628|nr:uncharacterized protein EI90DRAFT_3047402 [Cantharellus anzutake]KAF8335879.1 hypothetical protein EI90DRAFT_3047402 [Cantharellus anzutake]